MSNKVTFTDSSGKEVSKEEFYANQRSRDRSHFAKSRMTYTGVTRFPDGREVVEERTEKGGDLIRRSTRRVGVEVTEKETGKTQTLYTDSLPAGQRQQQEINVAGTAKFDKTDSTRFIPVLGRDDAFYDKQRGVSVRADERDKIVSKEGNTIRYRVEGRISPRDPQTSTTFTRLTDKISVPEILTRNSLYEGFTGKSSKPVVDDYLKTTIRTSRDIVINKPYLIPVAVGVGAVTGGAGIVAPKVATGIAVTGKTLLSGYLGFQTGRVGASGLGLTNERIRDILGETTGTVLTLGSAGGVGAKAGAFTIGKMFPVSTPQVNLRLPRETSYQRDVLTERLSPKQIIQLSKSPAPLTKSTITVKTEVPDTAMSGFQRFESSSFAPDFGVGHTASTKVVTQVIPVKSVPTSSQDFRILGRLTPKGLVQVRAFRPIAGKTAQLSLSPDVGTQPSTNVIGITRSKISTFSSGKFLPAPSTQTRTIFPVLGTSRSVTQNIQDVSTSSQPLNLTTTEGKTISNIDSLMNVRGLVTSQTISSPESQPLISSQTISSPNTQTDSPALSIPDIGVGSPFSPATKSPVFKFPNFKLPPLKPTPIIPNFNVGYFTRTAQPKLPKVRSSKPTKKGKIRKTRQEFEGIFDFKGLSLDLGRRRLVK